MEAIQVRGHWAGRQPPLPGIGAGEAPVRAATPLPEGSSLGGFEIVGTLGRASFGFVYLAYDEAQEHVAIREYLPPGAAWRDPLSLAVAALPGQQSAFDAGLSAFLREARLLARTEHVALPQLRHFWQDRGTAYAVVPYAYCQQPTWAQALAALGRAPDEDELLRLLEPLLDALALLHAAGCIHRRISPDSIVLANDTPVLLELGADASACADGTGCVAPSGFSPLELRIDDPRLPQGPWTDLYALAAVAYAAMSGRLPPDATRRLGGERLEPLTDLAGGRYSPDLLTAIDAALSLLPHERPPNAARFRALLRGNAARTEATIDSGPVAAPLAKRPAPSLAGSAGLTPAGRQLATRRRGGYALDLLCATVLVLAGIALVVGSRSVDEPTDIPTAAPAATEPPVAFVPAPAHARPLKGAPAATPFGFDQVPDAMSATDAPPAPVAMAALHPAAARAFTEPAAMPPSAAAPPPAPRPTERAESRLASAAPAAAKPRCTQLLQSASLSPLDAAETAFLKRECQR